MREHLPILMLVVPLAGSGLTLFIGFFSYRLSRWITYGTLLSTFLIVWNSFPKLLSEGPWHYSLGGWAPPWGIELLVTPFSAFLALFLLSLALITFYYLGHFGLIAGLLKSRESLGGSLLLILVSSLLAQLLVRDGFTLYLFVEMSIVAAVGLLLCVARNIWLDGFYFLLGENMGASLLLAGVLFLYASTGTTHLDDILAQLFIAKNFSMAITAGILMTAAWGWHFFFPSPVFFTRLLNQTPPYILGFFSSILVRVAAYLFFILLFFVLNVPGMSQPFWLTALEYLLAIFFLIDFIYAAKQKDFLHSVAYLSVAQLGFLFVGFILGNKSALTGALMELISQTLVVAGLFIAVGVLSLKPTGAHPISKLAGLGRHDFWAALALVIFAFSIVGFPPTGGFFGKFYLVQGILEKHDWVLLIVVGATLVFNLITASRFTWLLFEHRKASSFHASIPLSAKAPLLALALAVLLLGVFNQEVVHNFIEPALPKAFTNLPVPNVPFLGKQVE